MYAYVQNALSIRIFWIRAFWEVAKITFCGFIQKMFGEKIKEKEEKDCNFRLLTLNRFAK